MANITSYLESIKSAESGEVVRDSIIGALKKINADNPTVVKPLHVTANGTYSGDGVAFAPVTVDVAGGGSATIDIDYLDVSENGYYEPEDGHYYGGVNVQIPQTTADMVSKEITQNGIYDAEDDGYDGYSRVIVNVPQSGGGGPYTVRFHNADGTVMQIVTGVQAGGGAVVKTNNLPESSGMRFVGWSPNPVNVDRDMDCYPRFADITSGTAMISETWEEIVALIKAQGVDVAWTPGYWKTLELGEFGTVRMMLAGKGVDPLEGLNGYAPTTWVAMDLLTPTHTLHSGPDTNIPTTYGNCDIREWLNGTVLSAFPSILQKNIKSVVKYSYGYSNGAFEEALASVEKIWIPSHREVFGNYSKELMGPFYDAAFGENGSSTADGRKRGRRSTPTSYVAYWLRTLAENGWRGGIYHIINSAGAEDSGGWATNSNAILPCFCI